MTEENKALSWEERKREALAHIANFSHGSVLIKSADILSNVNEILDDHAREGEVIFQRFNSYKTKVLENYNSVAEKLTEKWPESYLAKDLHAAVERLRTLF